MMAWVAANRGVRAIGDAGDVTIRTPEWRDCAASPTLPRPVEETVSGAVSELEVPVQGVSLTDVMGRRSYELDGGAVLSDGAYLLTCRLAPERGRPGDADGSHRRTDMQTYLRFDGPARVQTTTGTVRVAFPDPRPVTIGFSEHSDDPSTITVPETPEGVATALTHLSAALRTTGPERSHPSFRDHPPIVELGEEVAIPDAVQAATPDTGIELQLPASYDYLFVGAPLAYYLGATVSVSDRAAPRLVAPAAEVCYDFRELPTFQHGVSRLLRQTFFFDTLVRDLDDEPNRQQRSLAATFDLDPARIRNLSPGKRLARYFWAADETLEDHLPEWHFSTSAAPQPRNVDCLPYLLDALSMIYLPESSELRGTELLERTLDDCYRSGRASKAPVQSPDIVKPELGSGRIHSWLAPGAPIDAFKTRPSAFENRRKYEDRRGTPLSVTVVLNDEEMADEHAAVADIYRERSADLPLSVDVREHLTREELADVFASPNDFVHYIGHCDINGLECADGNFSATALEESRTRTFFLNACGSYHEGLDLVERGSVAGAVTLTKVLDRQAAKVGTAFARLLVHGFGLEPAMQLSRRRIMMGKDYAVVGDGTYTLAPASDTPTVGWLESTGRDYRLTCEAVTARRNGDSYTPPFSDERRLHGTPSETTLTPDQLRRVLRNEQFPVIYDSEFYWSTDLATEL